MTLRRAVPGDAADVAEVYSEADVRHWMLWGPEHVDEAEALAHIARSEASWADGSWAAFRVVLDGHVVGGVNLHLLEYDTAELSYFLRTSARGRGVATRAVLLATDYGFRERGVQRVFARVDVGNVGSQAVVQRAGFAVEGVERGSAAYPDGRRFDSRVFAMLPADRVAIRPATEADVDFLTDTAMATTEDQGRFDSTTSVVTAYGADVGRLRVVRTDGLVELSGLQLLPAPQGRGLGTRVVRDLMAEATGSGRAFGLSVEKDNPRALALSARLGLVVVGEVGDEHVMRLPSPPLA